MPWLSTPSHARWLEQETDRLLAFGRGSVVPGGAFARQDDAGRPADGPWELWIACRMTHVYALGHLLGRPGSAAVVDHGLAALAQVFADDEHGGWFAEVARDGVPVTTTKAAYPHAFVVLATASATAAGRPGARALLDAALAASAGHFWDDEAGMVVEEWDASFAELDAYRGSTRTCTRSRRTSPPRTSPASGSGSTAPRGSSSAWCTASRAATAGASPSTSTPRGTRCSSTTPTRPRTRSGRTARRSATRSSGPV